MVTKAVVLAAGRGTRLGALTADVPKPMIEVAGRPFLHWKLEALQRAGITDVCIVTGYLGEVICKYFGSGRDDLPGLSISYVRQQEPNGTGGALLLGREFADAPFVACFGDILLHPASHYASAVKLFDDRQPEAVLAANEVPDPCIGAAVYFDESGRISRMVEKPPPGTSASRYNQAGCFIFRPSVFQMLERLERSPRGEIELTAAVSSLISAGREVLAYPVPEREWLDIGTPELLESTRKALSE